MNSLMEQANPYAAFFVRSCLWPMVWQLALLGGVIALASCTLFRKASPQFRHLLWLLVVVRVFLPPSLALPTSVANWGSALINMPSIAI